MGDSPFRPPGSAGQRRMSREVLTGRKSLQTNVLRGFLALVDQGFVSLNSFVTIILVAQLCGQSAVNVYALAWSVLNIVRVLQERLLAAPYTVLVHQPHRDQPLFLGSSLAQQAGFSLLTSLLFVGLGFLFGVYNFSVEGLSACMFMIALAAPFILLRDHLRVVSCSHFRYGSAVALSGGALAIQIAAMLVAYQLGWLNAVVVFATMGGASAITAFAWLGLRPQPWSFRKQQAWDDCRCTLAFSRWLVAARVFPSVASCLLPFIAVWLINEDAAGALVSCITLANVSLIFVTGANNFYQPRAVTAYQNNGTSGLWKVLLEATIVFTVVLGTMCFVYFYWGDVLLSLLFGEDFRGYGSVVGILGVYALITSYSIVAGSGMTAIGKPKGLFLGEASFAVATIGLALLLSVPLGIEGAAYALLGGSVAATGIAVAIFWRMLNRINPEVAGGLTQ